jgi:hypothetical protein
MFSFVICLYGPLFGISSGDSSRQLVIILVGAVELLFVAQFYLMCSRADGIRTTVSAAEVSLASGLQPLGFSCSFRCTHTLM